jgi:putative transposase
MARLPRAVFAGVPHLAVLRVQHGQLLAADDLDLAAALSALGDAMRSNAIDLHAYGIDEQRVEIVVTPPAAEALSRAMQAFARRHAAAFNRRHGRRGGLWAGRFEAAALDAEPWLLRAMVRVEQSPGGAVRACSSAAHHAGLRSDALISDPPAFWALGNTPFEREARYRSWLAEPLPAEWVLALDAAVRGGWPLGSDDFVAKLAERVGRPLKRRPRGRPAKPVSESIK